MLNNIKLAYEVGCKYIIINDVWFRLDITIKDMEYKAKKLGCEIVKL